MSKRVDHDLVEEDTGTLCVTFSGTLEDDVLGLGAGEHTVTVAEDGAPGASAQVMRWLCSRRPCWKVPSGRMRGTGRGSSRNHWSP